MKVFNLLGWSYGLSGKLAKAPRFYVVPNFNKGGYSLFKIHCKVDMRGFVYVNVEAADTPTTTWEEQYLQTDLQPRLEVYNMDDFKYDHSWRMDGNYNWKTLIDNYKEVPRLLFELRRHFTDSESATTVLLLILESLPQPI